MVIAFTQFHIEVDIEPVVHGVQHLQTRGEELIPQFGVFLISLVQFGGFQAGVLRDVRMGFGQLFESGILLDRIDLVLGRCNILAQPIECCFEFAEFFAGFFVFGFLTFPIAKI